MKHLHPREIFWNTRYPIPRIAVDDIAPTSSTLMIEYAPYVGGQLPLDQLLYLLAILKHVKPAVFLEIGTFLGNTTKHVALNSPETLVHTIDLPKGPRGKFTKMYSDNSNMTMGKETGIEFKDRALNITQHFADTAQLNFDELDTPSMFFIDGAHTYHYVKNDTEKCMKIATRGAVILWHDCDAKHPQIMKYLYELRQEGYDVGKINNSSLSYVKL